MLHNSTDIPGIAMHSQPEKWPKAEKSTAVECTHQCTGNQVGLVLRVNNIYFVHACIRCVHNNNKNKVWFCDGKYKSNSSVSHSIGQKCINLLCELKKKIIYTKTMTHIQKKEPAQSDTTSTLPGI